LQQLFGETAVGSRCRRGCTELPANERTIRGDSLRFRERTHGLNDTALSKEKSSEIKSGVGHALPRTRVRFPQAFDGGLQKALAHAAKALPKGRFRYFRLDQGDTRDLLLSRFKFFGRLLCEMKPHGLKHCLDHSIPRCGFIKAEQTRRRPKMMDAVFVALFRQGSFGCVKMALSGERAQALLPFLGERSRVL
jgi:hypothetical protein